jgi:hypothetical protein
MVWRNLLAVALMIFGCFRMVGHLADAPALRAIGAASLVAPLPDAFSADRGHEAFATKLEIQGRDGAGEAFAITLTPELGSVLAGPARRRQVYLEAFARAPRLPAPVWEAAWCHGLGADGPLRRELGLPPEARALELRITSRTHGRDDSWLLSPSCTR